MKRAGMYSVLVAAFLLALAAAPAAAKDVAAPVSVSAKTAKAARAVATPVALVKDFYAQLVDTMKRGEALGFAGRIRALGPFIQTAFNLPLMARFAVGPAWDNAREEERVQLVAAFSDFSVASWASRFTRYDGEKFEVLGEKPAAGGGSIVETRLTPAKGEAVTLNYLVRADEKGAPRIVDVFLDATISELATRRAEFSSIVRREGFGALVTTLGDKSRKLGPS